MSDETHAEIFAAGAPPLKLPATSPIDVPNTLRDAPSCATHCSGRHEIDSVLTCERCGGQKYLVLLHEWKNSAGHYFHELQPLNGAPAHPDHTKTPRCCKQEMRRR